MKPLPIGWQSWSGAALSVVVNLIVLGGVWNNRNGGPQYTLELTERELRLPYDWRSDTNSDNSGLALELAWNVAEHKADLQEFPYNRLFNHQPDWLNAEKLLELGFVLPTGQPDQEDLGPNQRSQSREVWFLLEFDGESFRRELANAESRVSQMRASSATKPENHALEAAETNLSNLRKSESRLMLIDADRDPARLRKLHSSLPHVLLARGQIRAFWSGTHPSQSAYIGRVEFIQLSSINVAARWRPVFQAIPDAGLEAHPPRYRVTVAYGARHEPWIVDAAILAESKSSSASR